MARLGVWLQLLPPDMVSSAQRQQLERGPPAPPASLRLAPAGPAYDRPFPPLALDGPWDL